MVAARTRSSFRRHLGLESLRIWQAERSAVRRGSKRCCCKTVQYQQTVSINKDTCNINQPQAFPSIPYRSRCFHPRPTTATLCGRIILPMDDPTDIDKERRRRQRNNARLQRQEDDLQLIADGQGEISLSTGQQHDTDCSPVGPRKAKTTALKNASEFLGSKNL